MSRKPTFDKTLVTTFEFERGETLPFSQPYIFNQIIDRMYGGTYRVKTIGSAEIRFTLVMSLISNETYDLLIAFFTNENINGMANEFTYTDSDAVEHTVRLVTPTIPAPIVTAAGRRTVTLELVEIQ